MTSSNRFYLREDAYFEPLFNHWYAWPYLLPPVTGARHLVKTHRRIMTSFVNNYDLHIMAVKEQGMAGAEFLDCNAEQLPKIVALIEELDTRCADLVSLANAVSDLDELLRNHTTGESIEPLYAKVPAALQGFVELFLDMEHRASYRFIEPLLYRSRYYRPALQSLSLGLLSRVEARPFVLSTPRLPDSNHVQIAADFNHPLVDKLFGAREIPLTQAQIEHLFDGVETQGGLSASELFAPSAPRYRHEPVAEGVRLSYTGHAGFLIETKDVAILVDPVIASRGEAFAEDVISYSQIPPKVDYICLTHNHQDHVSFETLLQLRYKTGKVLVPKNNGGTLADPSMRLMLRQLGFDAIEVDDLDDIGIAGGRVTAVPFLGEHGDLNIRSKTAWFIELLGRKLFFGADSSNPDGRLYERLGQMFHDIDVLAIGMECVGAPYTWLYGALHTKMVSNAIKNSRRLNGSDCNQALPMVEAFSPAQVFIYALGREPWYKYFMGIEYSDDSRQVIESRRMIAACHQKGLAAEALYGKKTVVFSEKTGAPHALSNRR
jgi:L-ascorbate metabolism protein UlaG (beta-lactamase superfamily)